MNVLVAEDNHFTAKQYSTVLEKNGHSVIITRDGKECLEKYNEVVNQISDTDKKNPIDVILLDNNMPEKSGIDVANEILTKNPNQRIIFASAYNIDSLKQAPHDLKKFVEIIQKPFSLVDMMKKIEKNVN